MKPMLTAAKRERNDVPLRTGSRMQRQRHARIQKTKVARAVARSRSSGSASPISRTISPRSWSLNVYQSRPALMAMPTSAFQFRNGFDRRAAGRVAEDGSRDVVCGSFALT
jgi:hypothetical protein